MKKTFKLLLVTIFIILTSINLNAQKIGRIDSNALIEQLPEAKQATATMEKETKEMQEAMEEMQVEYNKKLVEYQENEQKSADDATKWSASRKKLKEEELMQLQERMQKFNNEANKILQARQEELLSPILKKVQDAIKKVGKDKDFVFIMDQAAMLYYSDNKTIDVTNLVKKELGIN